MSWTDERVETLKKLWIDGLSASQIAKQLGSVTRNAVIGKVHRLGLAGRATPSRPAKRPTRPARPAVVAEAPPIKKVEVKEPVVKPVLEEPVKIHTEAAFTNLRDESRAKSGKLLSVLELGTCMCKWPIGDPTDAEFGFCGAKTHGNWPYCAEHGAVAYQPQLSKNKGAAQGQTITTAVDTEEEAKIRKAL
ncbi:GcrA family cell cycle regulator [Pseudaquidulcibacter saccharophilus]|uniref:GcrA family cell cycle regulator n=1 Tax=Pseudaquidulcibacter saccharophilus TaxID=2831900 RepID=UPI001EFF2756|nr:GcrA family cell cycle regulator [Pseudaquidulcibacter saccharophilus]